MPNLYPTIEVLSIYGQQTRGNVDFPKSPEFDFDKGEFVLSPSGAIPFASDVDAWVEWCRKALATERYSYPVYSANYGEEISTLLGRGYPKEVLQSEIRRMVSEALLSNERTDSVDNFAFGFYKDYVVFSCVITSVKHDAIKATWEVSR